MRRSNLIHRHLAFRSPGVHPMSRQYYVYILTNRYNRVLYTGVTNDLRRRVYEHATQQSLGFTQKYNANKLVYFETFDDIRAAIAREKQIKGGSRAKKLALIGTLNPDWRDLFEE